MRLLVLTQYYWPESFRITEVVESLLRVDSHVTVLTGQPNYPQGDVFDGYHAGGFGAQQHEAGYSIYRVPLVPRGRGGTSRVLRQGLISLGVRVDDLSMCYETFV